jgi:hypothetical protein
MKYLSVVLALAAFGVVGTVPALSRTIHHSTTQFARTTTHSGPLYLYRGGLGVWSSCQSPASLCAGEASQR